MQITTALGSIPRAVGFLCKSSNGGESCFRAPPVRWSLAAAPELESGTKGVGGHMFPKASSGCACLGLGEMPREARPPVPGLLCSVRTDLEPKGRWGFLKKPHSRDTFEGICSSPSCHTEQDSCPSNRGRRPWGLGLFCQTRTASPAQSNVPQALESWRADLEGTSVLKFERDRKSKRCHRHRAGDSCPPSIRSPTGHTEWHELQSHATTVLSPCWPRCPCHVPLPFGELRLNILLRGINF